MATELCVLRVLAKGSRLAAALCPRGLRHVEKPEGPQTQEVSESLSNPSESGDSGPECLPMRSLCLGQGPLLRSRLVSLNSGSIRRTVRIRGGCTFSKGNYFLVSLPEWIGQKSKLLLYHSKGPSPKKFSKSESELRE